MRFLPVLGAGGFGALVGWFVYYVNRYRRGDVQFSDITTLVGVLGGASLTSLFGNAREALFGAYGVGLFAGFFGYFITLIILVSLSDKVFKATWFLDGRRMNPGPGEGYGTTTDPRPPMVAQPIASLNAAATPAHTLSAPAAIPAQMPIDPTAARILAICDAQWDVNKGDCNRFVQAVASVLGVGGLTPPADSIVNTITGSSRWRVLSDGVEAKAAADAGEFVIGGLRSSEHVPPRQHGHVVVVVTGPLAFDAYPTAYWGSLDGTPYENSTINWAWRSGDRDRVHYAATRV